MNELKQRALNRASFLEDPSVLLRVVIESTGVGNVRNIFIKDAFSGPKVGISRLKELANDLKDPAERLAAWQGIARGLSLRESLAEIDLTVLSAGESPEEESALIAGLGGYPIARMVGLDEALLRARVVEALSVAKRLADEGSVNEGVPGDVVYEMSRNMSPKVWAIIEEAFPEISADPQIVARTMDRIARIYPMAVLDISMGNKAVTPEAVAKAVLNGLRDDSAKVETWFSENRNKISPVNELAVIGGIAEHYARSGDQEKAVEWIGNINDPAQRVVVEERIKSMQPSR